MKDRVRLCQAILGICIVLDDYEQNILVFEVAHPNAEQALRRIIGIFEHKVSEEVLTEQQCE